MVNRKDEGCEMTCSKHARPELNTTNMYNTCVQNLFTQVATYSIDMMRYLGILVLIQSCSLVDVCDDHTRTEEMQEEQGYKICFI